MTVRLHITPTPPESASALDTSPTRAPRNGSVVTPPP